MDKQKNDINAELFKLINEERYSQIRVPLEKLRSLANARPAGNSEEVALVEGDKVRETLDMLLDMFRHIEEGITPHEAYQRVISEPTASKGNVQNFSPVKFLGESITEIKRRLETIFVPVVLLAMTRDEALQLASQTVFEKYHNFKAYFDQFKQLENALAKESVIDLLQRYGDKREDWRPFGGEETIGELITTALGKVNKFIKPLQPEFVDIKQLTEEATEPPAKRLCLQELRKEGCMVVMDAISMHHPEIQRAYRRSLLDVFPHILVLKVAPTHKALKDQIKQEMLWFEDKFSGTEFYKRLAWDLDGNCDEVSDALDFMRLTVTRAPSMVDERLGRRAGKNNPTNLRNGVA